MYNDRKYIRKELLKMNLQLDEKIYRLQLSNLPKELEEMTNIANDFYLNEQDYDAEILVRKIENICFEKGYSLFNLPIFHLIS
jgi:hypothetical protein